VPPLTLPNWNVKVVALPSPICVLVLAWPPVMRLCDWASWVTLTLYLPGTAPVLAVADMRPSLLDFAVRALKVFEEFRVVSALWKLLTAELTWPYACSLPWYTPVFMS